jgi:ketosteroid isomerase-like protein
VRLFLKHDYSTLESLTTEDAFVYVQAPDALPWHGKYVGTGCVRQLMENLNRYLEIKSVPEVYYYVNESGSVFVAFDFEMQTVKDAAVTFRTSVLAKVKVNDEGKLTKVAIISDTLAALLALQAAGSL